MSRQTARQIAICWLEMHVGAVSCVRCYGDVLKHAVGESQRSRVLVTVFSPKGKMSLSEPCCSLGFSFFRRKAKIYSCIYYQTGLKASLVSESYNLLLTLNEMISFWSHSSIVGAWGWCKLWNVNVYVYISIISCLTNDSEWPTVMLCVPDQWRMTQKGQFLVVLWASSLWRLWGIPNTPWKTLQPISQFH